MNRETFLDTVGKQYADEIHEAYVECAHGKEVDFKKLNVLLKKLMIHAKVDGLSAQEFIELVKTELPDAYSKVDFTSDRRAA